MIIGIPKEIKTKEFRVGVTPANVKEYCHHGHTVLVESKAGVGSGFSDADYTQNGAEIVDSHQEVFSRADMIIKVKEPLPEEIPLLKKSQILYTYLHLAADKDLAVALLKQEVTSIAYETISEDGKTLPCLTPMSEIAGKVAIQEGARFLEKQNGGRGVLLGGVTGIERGSVVILGGGVVGTAACKIAVGMGAHVTILDLSASRLSYLDDIFGSKITTLFSTKENILNSIAKADLLIGAVLVPGATAPKLVSKEDLRHMKEGSVIVDVAVDQGGCIETTKATYHDNPTFVVEGVVHYCVANMPGSVPISSTLALTANTLKYGLEIADKGVEKALENNAILNGLNTYKGKCTNKSVAQSLNLEYSSL